jgi:UDP-N-acetylglucosamine--N-acetylmuramyl-(pentapeptide) pyrophosphoryl-undecaprenol N-acetylglucosamine transferase
MRVMFTGGGTGGHVFPLLAVADELKRSHPDTEFYWFGSKRLEASIVTEESMPGSFVPFTFSYRSLSAHSLAYYARIAPAWATGMPTRAARAAMDEFKPDVLLSSGGYVSVPALVACRFAQTPYALVEINAVPGRATVAFAPFARKVYCATEATADALVKFAAPGSLVVSGYPCRGPRMADAHEHFQVPAGLPIVVIVGGSSGAEPVNRLALEALGDEEFARDLGAKAAVLHQWGRKPKPGELERLKGWEHYRAIDFDPLLCEIYPHASLYVGRSGAATVCELIGAKLPAALIPYPHHADRQQYLNAEVLGRTSAAYILDEGSPKLAEKLRALIRDVVLGAAGEVMRRGFSTLDAANGAQAIAQDLAALLGGAGN